MGKMGKMIFVSYAKNHAGGCYNMYNPNTGYVTEMRDIIWLHCMYYGKPEARNEVLVYPQVALPFEPEDAEAMEGVMLNASEPKAKSKDNEEEWNTVHTRLGIVVKPPVLYMKEFGTDGIKGVLSSIHQNYYAQLCKLDDEETKNIENATLGAGLLWIQSHQQTKGNEVQGSNEWARLQ